MLGWWQLGWRQVEWRRAGAGRLAAWSLVLVLSVAHGASHAQGLGQGAGGFSVVPGLQGLQSPAEAAGEPLTLTAKLEADPATRVGRFSVTAKLANDYHIYSVTQPAGGPMRTKIQLDLPPGVTQVGTFQPDKKPEIHPPDKIFPVDSEEHHGQVTWTTYVRLADGVDAGSLSITGLLKGQVCHPKEGCRPIRKEQGKLEAKAQVAQLPADLLNGVAGDVPAPAGAVPPATESSAVGAPAAPPAAVPAPGGAGTVSRSAGEVVPLPPVGPASSGGRTGGPAGAASTANGLLGQIQAEQQTGSLLGILMLAVAGGFVLNLMPCVLPVIGLKIMSFVQQAGQDRRRVLSLNVAYSLGILFVFLILATLARGLGWGWGQQFSSDGFSIGLATVVFVMALSFLGVWEVPIPGFAASHGAQKLTEQEGYSGAFFKGVLATLLATPCSAPGITPALAWCVNKPFLLVYLVFSCMALGMALPYLVLGFRPELLRFLPRPGAWMETFKQLMGFVLMGTVVFLLTAVSLENILPTVALLFACWAGCWWIGRLPFTADRAARLRAWGVAATVVVLVGGYAFADYRQVGDMTLWGLRGMMSHRLATLASQQTGTPTKRVGFELPWEPFSSQRLEELAQGNQTVMVDFTADWCATCKTLELGVLNTRPIYEAVERLGVATLRADYDLPEVKELADRLGRQSIPILAIFPRGRADQPILLPTAYTRSQLLEALEQAHTGSANVARR